MKETMGGDPKTNPSLSATEPLALVDREGQLDVIAALVHDCSQGSGRLLTFTGAAGIGKTRLIAAARDQAHASGFRALHARAGELERAFSYGVVRQLFEPLLRSVTEAERRELLQGAAGLAAPLLDLGPVDDVAAAHVDPSFGTLHGLFWLTAGLAERQPLLLAVDDLQWCDSPSLRYLLYLLRRVEGLPVLVVAGICPEEPDVDASVIADLQSDPLAIAVRLQPLSYEGVATLLESFFGEDAAPAFRDVVFESCGGNPLLLRELIQAALDAGVPPTKEGSVLVRELAGDNVSGFVLRRVGRLGPDAITLARSVALLGEGADLEIAATLADLPIDDARDIVDKLVRMAVFQDRGRITFAHPMLRAAVYAELSETEKQLGHQRAARLLSERRATPEQIASHLVQTSPAGDPSVVSTLRDAARRAITRGAADAAVSYLRRALAEPPAAERVDVLLELGTAEAKMGERAAVDHRREAHDLGRGGPSSATSGMALARALFAQGRVGETADVLVEISDRLGGDDVDDRVEAELMLYCRLHRELYPLSQRILARRRERGIPNTIEGRAMRASIAAELVRAAQQPEEARAEAERAVSGGPGGGEIMLSLLGAIHSLVQLDALDKALEVTDAWLDGARRSGSVLDFASLSYNRYLAEFRRGDLAEAEADIRSVIDSGRAHGLMRNFFFALPPLAELLWLRGLKEQASGVLRESLDMTDGSATYQTTLFLESRGRVRLAMGLVTDALSDLLEAGERYLGLGMVNPCYSAWRSQAAALLSNQGQADEARRLVQEEIELARRWGLPRPIGIALRTAGLLQGGGGGLDLLRESVAALESSPARLEWAQSLIELGAALRRANDRVAARDPLHQGLDLATSCGAALLAERARDELLASGARPRRSAISGPEALTPSEARVARMAAEGRSNRDIAQTLFVTPKTVEVHLSNTYRKLGIRSRSQLADSLDVLDSDEPAHLEPTG
jgi:DNA-binding CsgD family transcriptional regulator/tetratricopeptide (TPR) repeat protein